MRFEGLDLNLLVAFNALAEERSVTAAARRLNMSQSAMSAAIGRLRTYFSDDLFTMVGRRLVPTALGQSLEQPTRDVLMRVRASVIARPAFEPSTSRRRFAMTVSDYASIVLMNQVLRRVYSIAPGVIFDFIPFDDRPDEQLLRGEVDFLIFPDIYLTNGHPKAHLFGDDFCCIAWTGSRKVGERLTVSQYLELGHVSAAFGPSRRVSFEERAIAEQGYKRRIEVVAQSFTMMATMVVGTDRIATIHRRLATLFAHHLPLKLIPAPIPIANFREGLQWPAPLDRDPAICWLRDVICDVAKEVDADPVGRPGKPVTLRRRSMSPTVRST